MVARGKSGDVGALLAKFPAVTGPMATWMSAYAIAASGKADDAKGRVSSIDPPPASAPLLLRIVAAAALGAMKDKKRGADYLAPMLANGSQNPDLVDAATALGFKKTEHAGANPTYEP